MSTERIKESWYRNIPNIVTRKLRRDIQDIAELFHQLCPGYSRPSLEDQLRTTKRPHSDIRGIINSVLGVKQPDPFLERANETRQQAYQDIKALFDDVKSYHQTRHYAINPDSFMDSVVGWPGADEEYGQYNVGSLNKHGAGGFDYGIAKQGPNYYFKIRRFIPLAGCGNGKRSYLATDTFSFKPNSLEYKIGNSDTDPTTGKTLFQYEQYYLKANQTFELRSLNGFGIDNTEYIAGLIYERLSLNITRVRSTLI